MPGKHQQHEVRLVGLWESPRSADPSWRGRIDETSWLVVAPHLQKQRVEEPDYIAFLAPQGGSVTGECAPEGQSGSRPHR